MRLLKAVLYLTLSICVIWGLTVSFGASFLGFVLKKSIGEEKIHLTDLKISPKLQLSASLAEFDFSESDRPLYGTIRAPKLNILFTKRGWLIKTSSGLSQVNDVISLPSLKADFYTTSLIEIREGQIFARVPELIVEEGVQFSDIYFNSIMNLASAELKNLEFSAKTASFEDKRSGDIAVLDVIAGTLAGFSFRRVWQSQRLDFYSNVEKLKIQSGQFGKINISSFSVDAQNSGRIVEAILMADNLSTAENGFILKSIKANPVLDTSAMKFRKETRVQIKEGRFQRDEPNKTSGNLRAVDAAVGLHVPERYLSIASDISDLEIWNEKFPLIEIPELAIDIKAIISPPAYVQSSMAQFKAAVNGEDGSEVTGQLAAKFRNPEGRDCLTEICFPSDISFNLKYDFEGEQLIASGRCASTQCSSKKPLFEVETSNTVKIVDGLNKQEIVNPLAMILFAGGIMQGEKVGLGHKINF